MLDGAFEFWYGKGASFGALVGVCEELSDVVLGPGVDLVGLGYCEE